MKFKPPTIIAGVGHKLAIFSDENGTLTFALQFETVPMIGDETYGVRVGRTYYSPDLLEPMLPVAISETETIHVPLNEALTYVLPSWACRADTKCKGCIILFLLGGGFGQLPQMDALPFMFNEHRDAFFTPVNGTSWAAFPMMVTAINKALADYVPEDTTDAT